MITLPCLGPSSLLKVGDHGDDSTSPHQALLSCAVLIQSATDWFIHSLMSSVQRLLGRPRVLLPLIRPFRMKFVRLRARAMCPKYFSFRLCTEIFFSVAVPPKSKHLSCVFSNWFSTSFCTLSFQMRLFYACLLPWVSISHNHTILLAKPGCTLSLVARWLTGRASD